MLIFFEEDEEYVKRTSRARIIKFKEYKTEWIDAPKSSSRNPRPFQLNLKSGFPQESKPLQAFVRIKNHTSVSNNEAFDYLSDPMKTDTRHIYDSCGNRASVEALKKTIAVWNQRNNRDLTNKNSEKRKSRLATHLILSTKESPDSNNIAIMESAVQTVQMKHFTQLGFDSYFVIHKDTDKLHAHLMVHNRNIITDQKIRFSRYSDLYSIRKDFAEVLQQNGLNYIASSRDPEDKTRKDQDYLTSKMVKLFGQEIEPFVKRQYVLANINKRSSRIHEARKNIRLFRDFKNPKSCEQIREKFDQYLKGQQKAKTKEDILSDYAGIKSVDSAALTAYVDVLYAKEAKLIKEYHSDNPESEEALREVQRKINNIDNITWDEIIRFNQYYKAKQLKKKEKAKTRQVGMGL